MKTNGKSYSLGTIAQRFNAEPGTTDDADWMHADPSKVVDLICAATAVGGAVRFGLTRDGGAYAVGIYGDGEPYTLYIRPRESIDAAIDNMCSGFQELRFSQSTPSQKPKKAS